MAAGPNELKLLMTPIDIKVEGIYLLRLVIAFVFGFICGITHDKKTVPIGIKTYSAVSIGACMFAIVSLHLFFIYQASYSLVIAGGVVAGIGFIGGGIIYREGANVQGLYSAATIWASAAIGLATGAGMYFIALGGTIFISLFHLFSRASISKNQEN